MTGDEGRLIVPCSIDDPSRHQRRDRIAEQPPKRVHTLFDAARDASVAIGLSSIVYHKLMYGAAASARRLLDFSEADATEAAGARTYLKKQGTPIGPYDVLIATSQAMDV